MATQKKTTEQNVFQPIEEAVSAGKEQFENVVQAGNEAATKQYHQAMDMLKQQVEKTSTAVFQGYDEVSSLNQANVDAVVKSSTVITNGFESLSRELMDFAQKQIETNVETTRKLFGATTVRELFDLQSDFARNAFDTVLNESQKVTEMGVKVANEALEPIQNQTSVAMEKAFKQAA